VVGSGLTQTLAYVQPDHLGTPRAIIDPARNVAVWTWDAKSEVFGSSPPNQDPDQDGVAFVFNMRFPGQRLDAASGLVYNYYRDYDPGAGRYIQSDPIGLAGGLSTYGYANGSPVDTADPFGLVGYVCAKGKNIGIAVPINFVGTNSETANRIGAAIEKAMTGKVGAYNVKTIVRVTVEGKVLPTINTVRMIEGEGTSYVDFATGNAGYWYYPGQWGMNTYPHEAGHFLGLVDPDGTGLMARDLNGIKIDEANLSKILDKWNNNIVRCPCE
jgi:RHS repeat-associated protein